MSNKLANLGIMQQLRKLPILQLPGGKLLLVSPILVVINILVFLALAGANQSFSSFDVPSLYYLGVNFSPWVEQGQWWRLFTSIFLHFGLMHLAFNCVSTLFLGRLLEDFVGRRIFLLVYLLSGIAGSLASFIFNKEVFSAGASGAVFGLLGLFIAILLANVMQAELRKHWLKQIGIILGLNLMIGLVAPVDNAAHLGGLAAGALLGTILLPLMKRRWLEQYIASRSAKGYTDVDGN